MVDRCLSVDDIAEYQSESKDTGYTWANEGGMPGHKVGRIKRFGQARRSVDMVNLVYHDTQDEKVYETLSRRMKDTFDIFGGLPDTIEDDWIESQDKLEERMNTYVHLRDKAKDVFELRYKSTIHPDEHRWELCSEVLSRSDIIEKLSEPW